MIWYKFNNTKVLSEVELVTQKVQASIERRYYILRVKPAWRRVALPPAYCSWRWAVPAGCTLGFLALYSVASLHHTRLNKTPVNETRNISPSLTLTTGSVWLIWSLSPAAFWIVTFITSSFMLRWGCRVVLYSCWVLNDIRVLLIIDRNNLIVTILPHRMRPNRVWSVRRFIIFAPFHDRLHFTFHAW